MSLGRRKINYFNKERFIINIDDDEAKSLKAVFSIPEKEIILSVLDDSLLKNLKQIVLFTDKKIYWSISNVYIKTGLENKKNDNNTIRCLDKKILKDASIYIKKEKALTLIFLVSENIELIIPFSYIQNESSLALSFNNYVSKIGGSYKPNYIINQIIYNKLSKTNMIINVNIVSLIFNITSYLLALLFLANLFTQYFALNNERIIYTFVLLKASGIMMGNRKSMYFYLILIIIAPLILYWFRNLQTTAYDTSIYILYTAVFITLGIFDFDKIFKHIVLVLSIASVLFMVYLFFAFSF